MKSKQPVKFIKTTKVYRGWGTENILTDSPLYLGKINFYKAGKAGGLQMHREKDETFHVLSGTGWLDYDKGDGKITRVKIKSGDTIHIPTMAVHRIEAITDLLGIEFSNDIKEDRHRCEKEYGVEVIGEEGIPSTW